MSLYLRGLYTEQFCVSVFMGLYSEGEVYSEFYGIYE